MFNVSALRLKNDGGFTVSMSCLWTARNGSQTEVSLTDSYPIGQSKMVILSHAIPELKKGDLVQIKAVVDGGKDNTGHQFMTYDPQGLGQAFKISGATLNNSLQYEGQFATKVEKV